MSSYLRFYIVPKRKSKEEPKQYIEINSYSASNDIYQLFNDNLQIAWAGNKEVYTTITKEDIDILYNDINFDISNANERLELYEKYAGSNSDYIQDIIDTRQYIKDLNETKSLLAFLYDMLICTRNGFNGIEEIVCNVI